ncbi:MAG: response regulator transcription factor [Holosporales bacterium]|jgi:two-component system phosphate regulon response regulator OmpR|nr:response regulator transcription factor [Holosporales bacterium]
MHSILVIDDDIRLLNLVVDLLRVADFAAVGANSVAEGLAALSSRKFDAIVVDWMMPFENGIEFITRLRSTASYAQHIPAMMLTALSDPDDKVVGFESGFDDYLTKPFETKELIVRLNAMIRRSKIAHTHHVPVVKFGSCVFDTDSGELFLNSESVNLSESELMLLKTLCLRPNHPFTREELAKKFGFIVSDRTIDVQITRLRKKIGDDTRKPFIIKTIRHIGYALATKP